jgi:transcriptional regulator GlxA family with amidase domain
MQSGNKRQFAHGMQSGNVHQVGDPRVRWVVEWLRHCDLSKPTDLKGLATSVHISGSRLRHVFVSEMGVTPMKFAKTLRLERARELLRVSFLEVKEVAMYVGFGDVSHFVRDYKALHGETPSDTRFRSKAG